MQTISDELTAPLGTVRRARAVSPARWLIPCLAGLCVLLVVGALTYIALFGDKLGGTPHARVEIGTWASPAPAADPAPAAPSESVPNSARGGAAAVESASGVSVVRPDGTAPPQSVIIRIPDEPAEAKLNPSPNPRLVERTRFGPLPRIGADGSRPLDIYARPIPEPPVGTRVAGRVAIVVGGLGISQTASADALAKLPPPVTLAFAPYGQDLEGLANRARTGGHEILLQIPMEPFDYPDSDPGPHTLTTAAKPTENIEHLQWAMGRLTGYVGLMNYMGGKLTADAAALAPVLKETGSRGLAFLDDGSSSRSLAGSIAGSTRAARAAVVLDAAARPDLIDKALEKLEAAAVSGGFAIGTASALPSTIERIARWSRGLEARGIILVPVSYAFRSKVAGGTSP